MGLVRDVRKLDVVCPGEGNSLKGRILWQERRDRKMLTFVKKDNFVENLSSIHQQAIHVGE